jgi:repressor LexA
MSTTTETFAQRLKELRKSQQVSLQDLAEILHTTRQSLSIYEKGERAINIELLAGIANYFDVSADYLLGLSKSKK